MLSFSNMQRLGSGLYASVYASKCNKYAVKHCTDISDGYLDYVKYALDNQGAPLIPTMHAFYMSDREYVVVLDRLFPMHESDRWKDFCTAINDGSSFFEDIVANILPVHMNVIVKELLRENPHQFFDAHGANWMIDGEDNLYLTDPFSRCNHSRNALKDRSNPNTDFLSTLA